MGERTPVREHRTQERRNEEMASRRKRKSQPSQKRPAASPRGASRAPPSTLGGRRALLTDVARCVAEGDSFSGALTRVAQACVPAVAEQCIVDLLTADGTVRRIEAAHADPAKAEGMRAIKRDYGAPSDASPVREVLRNGRPLLIREWTDELLERIAHDPVHMQILRRYGPKSSMCVPVKVRGETIAVLTFCITGSSPHFEPADLELAEEIAGRVGAALESLREGR